MIRKYCQSLKQNSKVHKHNTQRKLDNHVKLQKTEIYKKSVINMATKAYNNLPKFLMEIDDNKAFKKELNYSFFFKLLTQRRNLYLLSDLSTICVWLLIIQNINSLFYVELFVFILFKRLYKVIHIFKIYYRLTSLLSYV